MTETFPLNTIFKYKQERLFGVMVWGFKREIGENKMAEE